MTTHRILAGSLEIEGAIATAGVHVGPNPWIPVGLRFVRGDTSYATSGESVSEFLIRVYQTSTGCLVLGTFQHTTPQSQVRPEVVKAFLEKFCAIESYVISMSAADRLIGIISELTEERYHAKVVDIVMQNKDFYMIGQRYWEAKTRNKIDTANAKQWAEAKAEFKADLDAFVTDFGLVSNAFAFTEQGPQLPMR